MTFSCARSGLGSGGSVFTSFPRPMGQNGGGRVRITAQSMQLDGAILTEGGFHTHYDDVVRLQTVEGQVAMARAIFAGLLPFCAPPTAPSFV